MTKAYQKRRALLYAKDPFCPICHRKMRLVKFGPHGGESGFGKARGDVATIDHIRNKLSGNRQQLNDGTETTRLVCKRCNNRIQKIEFAAMPKEQQWKRSGGYPTNWQPLDAGLTTYKMRLREQWGD